MFILNFFRYISSVYTEEIVNIVPGTEECIVGTARWQNEGHYYLIGKNGTVGTQKSKHLLENQLSISHHTTHSYQFPFLHNFIKGNWSIECIFSKTRVNTAVTQRFCA